MGIQIRGYGEYSGDNYGVNALMVTINGDDFYFSYSTCIAFRVDGNLVIRKNDWSTVTGKHLNWINTDKKIRISGAEFEAKLKEVTEGVTFPEIV